MKYKKIIIGLIASAIILTSFYEMNRQNYGMYLQIRDNFVKHPENLPTVDSAKATAFGFSNMKADWYFLNAIQYIGGNAVSADYKKYLYQMMDVITGLNPYFERPYILGQLLLPSHNTRYENLSDNQVDANIKQAELLGLKGVRNFCDLDKIDLIDKETDLLKIWNDELYANPCKSYELPYALAFVYWQYLNDPLSASKYYKVASANRDAIEGTKVMSAIMQGKGGEREKSFFMFLNLSEYVADGDQTCIGFSREFQQLGSAVFQNKLELSGPLIENIQNARENTFGEFSGDDDDIQLKETNCISYINKAVREVNLYYIEEANKKYQADNGGKNSKHAKELFDKGYIDFLPRDFQQYEDYEVIYEYNLETQRYDYGNGNYR